MAFQKAFSLDDLWEGDMEVCDVGETEVLLVNIGGTVHAVQSICPHQEVDLVEGELEGGVLTCRMHLWQFDIESGKGINPDHAKIARYPVRVEGDDIWVDVEGIEPEFSKA